MPKGYPLSPKTKREILDQFIHGKARSNLAREYGLHIKTMGKLIDDAKRQRRAELSALGYTREEIERAIDWEYRGDCKTFITIEYRGRLKKDYLLGSNG